MQTYFGQECTSGALAPTWTAPQRYNTFLSIKYRISKLFKKNNQQETYGFIKTVNANIFWTGVYIRSVGTNMDCWQRQNAFAIEAIFQDLLPEVRKGPRALITEHQDFSFSSESSFQQAFAASCQTRYTPSTYLLNIVYKQAYL